MGWYYTLGASRKDIIQELTGEIDPWAPTTRFKTLHHCASGNTLWAVHEFICEGPLKGKRWIGCYLLSRGSGDGWGYKPMDESMGPFYYSCPLKYLSMVPAENEEWRAGVVQYWEERRLKRERKRERR